MLKYSIKALFQFHCGDSSQTIALERRPFTRGGGVAFACLHCDSSPSTFFLQNLLQKRRDKLSVPSSWKKRKVGTSRGGKSHIFDCYFWHFWLVLHFLVFDNVSVNKNKRTEFKFRILNNFGILEWNSPHRDTSNYKA